MSDVNRSLALLCSLLLLVANAVEGAPTRDPDLTIAFGGSGGTLPPVPPLAGSNISSQAPCSPTVTTPGSGPVLLQVVSRERHLVLLRSARGRLLAIEHTDALGRVVLPAVPTDGALLDVVGTDCVGLPVTPWSSLVVITP